MFKSLPRATIWLVLLVAAIAYFWDRRSSFQDARATPQCAQPAYNVRILSDDPLMIYVENLLTQREIEHLLLLANPRFSRSLVQDGSLEAKQDDRRTSSTAVLPDDDPVVGCIMERAARFQGFGSTANIEPLQATKYTQGQYIRQHYDWVPLPSGQASRLSTFFVTLLATCEDCGTEFPRIQRPRALAAANDGLCKHIDCSKETLVVNPVPGNGLFWRNVQPDGQGHNLTRHAGLPLSSGDKVGLNIWTDAEGGWR